MRAATVSAVIGSAVIGVACSSGTKKTTGGSLASGNYTTSNFASTNDGCAVASDPGSVDLFVTGNVLVYDGASQLGTLTGTISGGQANATASAKSYDADPAFASGYFCTVTETETIAGAIAGGSVDITDTVTSTVAGPECTQAGEIPCTTVMTYKLTNAGPTSNPSPNPTPETLTGTGSLTTSAVSPLLSDAFDSNGTYTPGLTYDFSLTGGVGNAATSAWYCFLDPADLGDNFGVESSDFNFAMSVAPSKWTTSGPQTVDPENGLYISILASNGEQAIATGGTVTFQSAGTTPDTAGQNCRFSFSGLTFGADVTPFSAPHRAPRNRNVRPRR